MLKHYKMGKLSLEGLAKKLDISISEAVDTQRARRALRGRLHPALPVEGATQAPKIDQLAEFGIEAPIEFEDYLKGFEVFEGK